MTPDKDYPDKFVYFARGNKSRLIKIGCSVNPDHRTETFKPHFDQGEAAKVIFAVPGAFTLEHEFHRRFAEYHDHGEWFKERGKLKAFIRDGAARHKTWRNRFNKLSGAEAEPGKILPPVFQKGGPLFKRIGICKTPEGEKALRGHGIAPEHIWMCGRDLESVEEAKYYCRGRPAEFAITEDLRILGTTQKQIFETVSDLTKAGIQFIDLEHPADDIHAMQHRAFKAMHAANSVRNHRTARRRGSMGGTAKAANAAARRQAEISDAVALRLCASRLTWKEKSEILGMTFSTMQRYYSAHKS